MKYTALFLVALVALTFAAKSRSPADQVLDKIDDLVGASRDEQAEQTRIYVDQSARCQVEEAFRSQEVQDGQLAASSADQQLQICNAELPVAQAADSESQEELQETVNQQASLQAQFGLYQSANLDRQEQHQDALNNIEAAYNIVGSFQNGKAALDASVFLEVTKKLNKIFKTAVKHKFHKHMTPVMNAMVQITQSPEVAVSTDSLSRLVSLFHELEDNVKQSEDNRANEWTAYSALFDNQNALLQTQVDALSAIHEKYDDYIQSLEECQRVEGAVLAQANAKVSRNSAILSASVDMCDAYDNKYEVQTQQRTDYVALLGQLRSFVVSAISDFKSGIYGSLVQTKSESKPRQAKLIKSSRLPHNPQPVKQVTQKKIVAVKRKTVSVKPSLKKSAKTTRKVVTVKRANKAVKRPTKTDKVFKPVQAKKSVNVKVSRRK